MFLCVSQRLWPRGDLEKEGAVFDALVLSGADGVAALGDAMAPRDLSFFDGVTAAREWVRLARATGLEVPVLLDPVTRADGWMFGVEASACFARFRAMVVLAGDLEIERVVLGAPGLRRRDLPLYGTPLCQMFLSDLLELEELALKSGVQIGIKPVPRSSGARFWTSPRDMWFGTGERTQSGYGLALDSTTVARAGLGGAELERACREACVFIAQESGGGPLVLDEKRLHETASAALAKARVPDWMVWDGDEIEGGLAFLKAHLLRVRVAYSAALGRLPHADLFFAD